jgi:hypothetical protein
MSMYWSLAQAAVGRGRSPSTSGVGGGMRQAFERVDIVEIVGEAAR